MIIVTGTKRSGTSAWMQVLVAAGLPPIGDAFPARFAGLAPLNPAGFWESRLRRGVYFATNPDPQTGAYLHPEATRQHALKIFVPGLLRTDHAFLDRVIATVRPWREYTASMQRMHTLEDQNASPEALARRKQQRDSLPLPVEWWLEVYHLIRDLSVRRYPFHLVTYDRLLQDPAAEIRLVLGWLGVPATDEAIAAVRPRLRTQAAPAADTPLDAEAVALFDDLYAQIHEERVLHAPMLARMNALHARLPQHWKEAWARRTTRGGGEAPPAQR